MRRLAELLWHWLKGTCLVQKQLGRERERMKLLHPGESTEKAVDDYYVETIALLLKIVSIGLVLFLIVLFYEECCGASEIGVIERNEYGEGSKQINLMGSSQDGLIVTSRLQVNERVYTQAEIKVLFDEVVSVLPGLMAGKNSSLDWIETSLELPTEIEGFPFLITWRSNDRSVISDAGVLQDLYREEETTVCLRATFQYEEFEENVTWDVTVAPSLWTKQQIWEWEVEKTLQSAEEESLTLKQWSLPDRVGGNPIYWKIKDEEIHMEIIMLCLICVVLVLWGRSFEVKRKLDKRKVSLEEEYNSVISRLVLYLGAGLPIKRAWEKTAIVLKKMYPNSIVAQEMLLANREMESGFLEKDCYIAFGKRCGRQEYMRLGTLLSQNLKRGNSELLKRLREEVKMSGEQQKHIVRRRGEEATTKLLAPMMMLLAMTMILIMLPAFMGIN